MLNVVVDIGSKVARALDASTYGELVKVEHGFGKFGLDNSAVSPSEAFDEILRSKEFSGLADPIISKLNKINSNFGIARLAVVATGSIQKLNEDFPGMFSCAFYARSVSKGDVRVLPLVWKDNIQINPQTRYATSVETALLSPRSRTALAIRDLSANILALRGSGISLIQVDGPIRIGSDSIPKEYRYDVSVSGSDRFPRLKSFDEIVEFYDSRIADEQLTKKLIKKDTIIIGKGARDLIELKLNVNLDNLKRDLSVNAIRLCKKDLYELSAKIHLQLKDKTAKKDIPKKLYRARNTLGFLAALMNRTNSDTVLLSDAKFSDGLIVPAKNVSENFKEFFAKRAVGPFFETFSVHLNSVTSGKNSRRTSMVEREDNFVESVCLSILEVQKKLDADGIDLSAWDLFFANSYPYVPERVLERLRSFA